MAKLNSGFGLRQTCVNSFHGSAEQNPSYIMSLACDASEVHAAVAGSEFDLKIYERESLRLVTTLAAPAHSGRINEIAYAPAGSVAAGTLFSASSDGSVRGWDTSAPPGAGPSVQLRGRDEVWSISASDGPLLAAGTDKAVVLWDLRKASAPVASLEVHTEAVTAVRFQPGSATSLVSGSVDELICSIDCRCRARSRHQLPAPPAHRARSLTLLAAEDVQLSPLTENHRGGTKIKDFRPEAPAPEEEERAARTTPREPTVRPLALTPLPPSLLQANHGRRRRDCRAP